MNPAEQSGRLDDNLFWDALGPALKTARSATELLQSFLGQLAASVPTKRAVVFLFEPNSASYEAVGASGLSLDAARVVRSDPNEKSARWLRISSPVLNLRGKASLDYPEDLPEEEVARLEALGTPLLVGFRYKGRLLGWLSLDLERGELTEASEQVRFLVALADRLAIAIDNLQLEARAEGLSREMQALAEIAKKMVSTLDFERVLDFIAAKVQELLQADAVLLFLSEQNSELTLRTALGDADLERLVGTRIALGQGIAGTVALDGRAITTIEARGDLRFWKEPKLFQDWAPRSLICVRLQAWGRVVGALEVLTRQNDRVFNERDLGMLNYVADHAAIAINNAGLYSITEQALAAQVEQNDSLRAELTRTRNDRAEFVSLVAHELKVPMTSIKGYAKLLGLGTAGSVSDSQREFLQVITRNVDRMDRLVATLLDLSRLDAGRVALSPQELKVETAIQLAVRSHEGLVQTKSLQLVVHVPPEMPSVYADPARLEQILNSLIGNACQYTPEGGDISIQAFSPPLSKDRPSQENAMAQLVEIRVSDTGIGIAEGDQPRVFEQFFRGDHPLVQEAGGTGFSLMVVKRLVQVQGGYVGFSSTLGQGSQFYFVLPAAGAVSSA